MGKETVELSKIQTAEEGNDERYRKGKAKYRETTRPTANDKAHGRIHQEHKAIRTMKAESGHG